RDLSLSSLLISYTNPTAYPLLNYFTFFSCHRHHQNLHSFPTRRSSDLSFTVFPEIVPSIGNSFINTMKNINHTRSSISDDIRNILCSSANMRRAIPLILRLLMN